VQDRGVVRVRAAVRPQVGSAFHVGQWVDQYAMKGTVRVDLAIDDAEEMALGAVNLILKP